MSMRGGYQIIDLKNVPLYSGFLQDNGENHIHVKGIYYNLYHSNAKMILLSGLNMDNKPHRDYEIIPYEEDNEFKAILKKVWNTDKHMVYTYFLHIAEDDDVYVTYEELDYDRVDKEFNEDSDVAIANSTVTKKVNALDAEDLTFLKLDGSRHMTGSLDFFQHQIKNAVLSSCKLGNTLNGGNFEITNLANPTGSRSAVTRQYVDGINTNNHAYFDGGNIDSSSASTSFNIMITNQMFIGQIKARSALTSVGNIIPVNNDEFEQIKLIAKSLGAENIISFSGHCSILINESYETIQVTVRIDISSTNATISFNAGTASQAIPDGIYTFYGVVK